MFLELAVAGRADILVSGDADLLDFAKRSPISILSPADFKCRFDKQQGMGGLKDRWHQYQHKVRPSLLVALSVSDVYAADKMLSLNSRAISSCPMFSVSGSHPLTLLPSASMAKPALMAYSIPICCGFSLPQIFKY